MESANPGRAAGLAQCRAQLAETGMSGSMAVACGGFRLMEQVCTRHDCAKNMLSPAATLAHAFAALRPEHAASACQVDELQAHSCRASSDNAQL